MPAFQSPHFPREVTTTGSSLLFTLILYNHTIYDEPSTKSQRAAPFNPTQSYSPLSSFGPTNQTIPTEANSTSWTRQIPNKSKRKPAVINATVPAVRKLIANIAEGDEAILRSNVSELVNGSVSFSHFPVVRRALQVDDMQIYANIGNVLSHLELPSTTQNSKTVDVTLTENSGSIFSLDRNLGLNGSLGGNLVNGPGNMCNLGGGMSSTPRGSAIMATILILLSVFGILGNAVSVIIFLHVRMRRNPINLLLSALSIMDFFVNATFIPTFALPALLGYNLTGHWSKLNIVIVYLTYPIGMIAQSCSNWFFVAITIERFWAVCHPLSVVQVDSGRARRIIGLIVSSGIIYNLTRFWEFTLDFDICPGEILTRHLLRENPTYVKVYVTAMYAVFIFLIPFVILTALNICIIRSIRFANKMRSRLNAAISTTVSGGPCSTGGYRGGGPNSTKLSPQEAESQKRTTIMILIITFKFIACNILPCALHILESVNRGLIYGHTDAIYVIMTSYILFLGYSSSSCFIYWAFSGKYRNLARLLFQCELYKPQKYLAVPTTCTS